MTSKNSAKWLILRCGTRTTPLDFLAPDPDGLIRVVGIASRRAVGYQVWLNAVRTGKRRCSGAMSFSERFLPPPDLHHREHGKDHLSAETDRSSQRSVRGKLIHERSTEYGTESDFSRHQHQECDEPHQ